MRQFTFWSHTQHWPATDKRVFGKSCTWPVQSPTTRSAMKVSSVSPERWLTITPHPLDWAILQLNNGKPNQKTLHTRSNVVKLRVSSYLKISTTIVWDIRNTHAWRDSVTEPIWLTLSSRQLQALSDTALAMRLGLVTVRSSPTTWMLVLAVKLLQASQSSWSNGSSMETTEKQRWDLIDLGWSWCDHLAHINHTIYIFVWKCKQAGFFFKIIFWDVKILALLGLAV